MHEQQIFCHEDLGSLVAEDIRFDRRPCFFFVRLRVLADHPVLFLLADLFVSVMTMSSLQHLLSSSTKNPSVYL